MKIIHPSAFVPTSFPLSLVARSTSEPASWRDGAFESGEKIGLFPFIAQTARLRLAALLLAAFAPLAALQAQVFYATPYTFTTLAGSAGIVGSANGTGSAAQFSSPYGLAVDGSGNIYVADSANHLIRKITPGGAVTLFAGTAGSSGSTDAIGSAARFNFPFGVAVDGPGNVYVADYFNFTIRKITAAGVVTTLAGAAGSSGSTDATGSAARFKNPDGIAVDESGNVYVADYNNHTIRKITAAGVVTTLAGTAGSNGTIDGTGSAARFSYPSGVAADGSGNVYVTDYLDQSIRKITSTGVVTSIAGSMGNVGSTDGNGGAALFKFPVRVAVDGTGGVYVSDNANDTIRKGTLPTQPANRSVNVGYSVTLTAVASGTPTPAYQWQKDGVNISGATSSFYMIVHAAAGDAGNYTVSATNSAGAATNITHLAVTSPGDFNGDTKTDILWTNTVTGDRAMWVMNGLTATSGAIMMRVPLEWSISGTGDFDGDGKADILWTNTVTGDRVIWLMNGYTGTSVDLGIVPLAWSVSGIGDFNGDGMADILWTNTATTERAMWLMNGTMISSGAIMGTVPLAWSVSGTGDFDGDGKADILWTNTATGDRAMWLMNGMTATSGAVMATVPLEWSVSGTGDFDGDGKADILWTNTVTGDRVIWLMNGTTGTSVDLGLLPLAWSVSATGDFNGDGKADILWTNTTTTERAMWLMNGTTISSGAVMGSVPLAWSIIN